MILQLRGSRTVTDVTNQVTPIGYSMSSDSVCSSLTKNLISLAGFNTIDGSGGLLFGPPSILDDGDVLRVW